MRSRESTTSSRANPRLRCETVPLVLCLPGSMPSGNWSAMAPAFNVSALAKSSRELNRYQFAWLHLVQVGVKDGARHKDCREQVGQQSECQRGGKTLHWTGAEQEQNCRRYDGRHVRVDDGDPGVSKALVDSR